MHATRAAVEEGILPGGGVALLRAAKVLEKLKGENEDQRHGVEIVRKAISWPARQIAINAGEDGSVIVGKIQEKENYGYGFDAQNGEFGNLVSKEIIDPTKVVRTALQDAASIAGLLITTEAMVAELPKKRPIPPRPCQAAEWGEWITKRLLERHLIGARAFPPGLFFLIADPLPVIRQPLDRVPLQLLDASHRGTIARQAGQRQIDGLEHLQANVPGADVSAAERLDSPIEDRRCIE